MRFDLADAIYLVGWGQLSVLVASALVPLRLNWRTTLASLPLLLRQLFWIYGGYVVLSIIGLGTVCILNSSELATGSSLARAICIYAAIFWGTRLCLQPFLAAKPYLNTKWLRAGYHLLSILFISFVFVMSWAAFH